MSRVIYTFSWFDAAAASHTFTSQLHYTPAGLGELLSAFMAGAGVFQIPAGIYSARHGPRRAVTLGLALIAIGSLASATSPQIAVQVPTRLLTGVGAAFFFAPAMVLVSGLYSRRSGLLIGIYNAAFNLGGGLTLFTLTPAAALWGWRAPYIATGALTLAALTQHTIVFRGVGVEPPSHDTSGVQATLKSRVVWGVALGILGLSVAYYVASQFMVDYASGTLNLDPTHAGLLSSLILFGGLLGGPTIGSLSDRAADRRIFVVASTISAGLCVALFSYPHWPTLVGASLALGFFDSAAYTIAYAIPTDAQNIGRRYAPLAVGLINSVGIMCGSVGTALFGYAIPTIGYGPGWMVVGGATALTLPALKLVSTEGKSRERKAGV